MQVNANVHPLILHNTLAQETSNSNQSPHHQQQLTILALGDLHIKINNIQNINIYFNKLRSYLDTHPVDIIIILGDVLDSHERLHLTCLNKAIEYVNLVASYTKCYVIVGNHDSENNSIFLTTNHWMNCLKNNKNTTVVDNVVIDVIKKGDTEYKLTLLPYVPDNRLYEALNTRKGEWETSDIIFSHITIKGADMGSVIAENAETWESTYPMLVSGHIHKSQWIADNFFYCGSIMQTAIDEDPRKIIGYITLDKSIDYKVKIHILEENLHLPKKVQLEIDITDIEHFDIPTEPDTQYKLLITGNYEQYKAFKKSNYYKELSKAPHVLKIDHKQQRADIKSCITKLDELQLESRKKTMINFKELLTDTIMKNNDELLMSFYDNLMNPTADKSDLSDFANLKDVIIL